MISASAETYGFKLSASQIQDLFDYIEKLKSNDRLQDEDLNSEIALAKHIQRKSHLYDNLFKLDKK